MNKTSITQKLRNKAKELNSPYNVILNQFFFDEFLKLLSLSPYREKFMLKGGMLLTYTLGVQNRATNDIDVLIKGLKIENSQLKNILAEIVRPQNFESVWFEIIGDGETIRVEDEYGGVKFRIIGHLANIQLPFSLDIATGDPVYPEAKENNYTTILGESFLLKQYPIESVLSEKLQTVIMRAESNGRSKDFYDIYTILKVKSIDYEVLKTAVALTFNYRGTELNKEGAKKILIRISQDTLFQERWNRYIKKNPYTNNLEFQLVLVKIEELIDSVM